MRLDLDRVGKSLLIFAPIGVPLLFFYISWMGHGTPPPPFAMWGMVLFAPGWCLASLATSHMSGWQRLATIYAARTPPVGRMVNTSGKLGDIWLPGGLNVHMTADGLFLSVMSAFRIGHKPLFIPWSAMQQIGQKREFLWREGVQFEIGTPRVATMWLPKRVCENWYDVT